MACSLFHEWIVSLPVPIPAGPLYKGNPTRGCSPRSPFPIGAYLGYSPLRPRPPPGRKKSGACCWGNLGDYMVQPWQRDIGLFRSEWGCCVLLLSQSALVWARGGEQAEGRGLTLMSWTQWSEEVPWMQRREGWMPASWKALLMSSHFCCSGSEMVHQRTSITPSTVGQASRQPFLVYPARGDPTSLCGQSPATQPCIPTERQ